MDGYCNFIGAWKHTITIMLIVTYMYSIISTEQIASTPFQIVVHHVADNKTGIV